MSVLIGVGDDKRGLQALDFALDLYRHHDNDPSIHVLHVTPDMQGRNDDVILQAAQEHIDRHPYEYDVHFEFVALNDVTDSSTVAEVFLSYADQIGAEHAFLGYPAKSITSELFGAGPRRAIQSGFRGGKVTLVRYHTAEGEAHEKIGDDYQPPELDGDN